MRHKIKIYKRFIFIILLIVLFVYLIRMNDNKIEGMSHYSTGNGNKNNNIHKGKLLQNYIFNITAPGPLDRLMEEKGLTIDTKDIKNTKDTGALELDTKNKSTCNDTIYAGGGKYTNMNTFASYKSVYNPSRDINIPFNVYRT